jgi:hypothetical protein
MKRSIGRKSNQTIKASTKKPITPLRNTLSCNTLYGFLPRKNNHLTVAPTN